MLQPIGASDSSSRDSTGPAPTVTTAAAAAIGPADRLAAHASLLANLMSRPDRIPARWRAPGFARQVDLVRAHLRPIHSRESLALSYAREHFHVDSVGAPMPLGLLRRSATEVAYAHRWLELEGEGEGRGTGPWISLLGAAS